MSCWQIEDAAPVVRTVNEDSVNRDFPMIFASEQTPVRNKKESIVWLLQEKHSRQVHRHRISSYAALLTNSYR
jgi:hypothetical protein